MDSIASSNVGWSSTALPGAAKQARDFPRQSNAIALARCMLFPVESTMSVVRSASFVILLLGVLGISGERLQAQEPFRFHLMEATIPDVHRAIQEGQITCRGLVQAYLNRARAYNGTCNQLVTEDNASRFLPNYDEYKAA